jgi:hypothetical protein
MDYGAIGFIAASLILLPQQYEGSRNQALEARGRRT